MTNPQSKYTFLLLYTSENQRGRKGMKGIIYDALVWIITWRHRGGAKGGVELSRSVLLLAAAPARVQGVGRWRGHLEGDTWTDISSVKVTILQVTPHLQLESFSALKLDTKQAYSPRAEWTCRRKDQSGWCSVSPATDRERETKHISKWES